MGPKKSRDFATKKRVTGSSNMSARPRRKTSSSIQIPSALFDSTSSEESKSNLTEESSVEEHRRKNLEWHETRQIENFKRAQERRAKEREEKNLELVLSPDKNGASDSTTSESEDDVVTTDPKPTKGTLKPPSDVECQLLKRVKPFSQLPKELWEKRVQPKRKKTVPLPPPFEQNQTDSSNKQQQQQEVGSRKEIIGGFQPTHVEGQGEHLVNVDTSSINRGSRKFVKTTECPAVQHASKRQRLQQLDTPEDDIRTQLIDRTEEPFTSKKLLTSTPFPSKVKPRPLTPSMSPVTPQSDNRPFRNVIHTQKVKTQTKIPVRVGVLARKNAAQSLESSRKATPSQPKLSTQDRKVTDPPDSGHSNGLHPKPISITAPAQKNTTFDVSHGFGSGRPRVERTPLLHPSSAQAKQLSNDSSSNEDDEDPPANIPKGDLATAENRPSSKTLSTTRNIQEPLRGNSEQQRELQFQSVEVAPPSSNLVDNHNASPQARVADKQVFREKVRKRASNALALLAADVSSDSEEDLIPVPRRLRRTISITRPRPMDSPIGTTGRIQTSSQIHRVSCDPVQKESEQYEAVVQPVPHRTTRTNKPSVAPPPSSDVQKESYSRPRSTSPHDNSVKQKPPPSPSANDNDRYQSHDGSDPEENKHALETTLPMHKSPKSSKQRSLKVQSQQPATESSSEEEEHLKNTSRKPSLIIPTRGARKESSTNLPAPPPSEVVTQSQNNHNESYSDCSTSATPPLQQRVSVVQRATSPLVSLSQSQPENNVRVSSRQMSIQEHEDERSVGQPADAFGDNSTSESEEEEAPRKLRKTGGAGVKTAKVAPAPTRKPKKKPAVALPALRTRARNQSEKSVHHPSPPPPPSEAPNQSLNNHNESDTDCSSTSTSAPAPLPQATSPLPLSQSRPEYNVRLSSRQMLIQEHEDERSVRQAADAFGDNSTSKSEEEEAPRKLRKTGGVGVKTAKVVPASKRKPKKKPAVVLPALRTRARSKVEKSVHHPSPPPHPSEVLTQNNHNDHNESYSDCSTSAPPPLQQRVSVIQRATSPLVPLSQSQPGNNVRLSSRQISIQEHEDERSVGQPADAFGNKITSESEEKEAPRKLRGRAGAKKTKAKTLALKSKPKKKPAVVLPALRTRARNQVEKSVHQPSPPPPPQILDQNDDSERQNERRSSPRRRNPDRKSYSYSQPEPASTTTVDKTFNRGARMSLSQPVRLTGATSSQPLSQHSIRSRESHRRSVFEVARATSIIAMSRKDTTATNAVKKGRGPRREEPTERYVGKDIFGNYQIMKSEDVAKILNEEKPNHGLDEEHAAQLSVRVNHFLEDFFTHHCEDTPQPYGFMTFQNLKTAMVEQCLLEEDATADDLMQEMKKSFSKQDWKRSEGILYPSRYSNKVDTADYYFK